MTHVLIFISVYRGNIWQIYKSVMEKMSLCFKNYMFPFRYLQVHPILMHLPNSVKHQPCFSLQRYGFFFIICVYIGSRIFTERSKYWNRILSPIENLPLAIANRIHMADYLLLSAACL